MWEESFAYVQWCCMLWQFHRPKRSCCMSRTTAEAKLCRVIESTERKSLDSLSLDFKSMSVVAYSKTFSCYYFFCDTHIQFYNPTRVPSCSLGGMALEIKEKWTVYRRMQKQHPSTPRSTEIEWWKLPHINMILMLCFSPYNPSHTHTWKQQHLQTIVVTGVF